MLGEGWGRGGLGGVWGGGDAGGRVGGAWMRMGGSNSEKGGSKACIDTGSRSLGRHGKGRWSD